MVIAIDRPPADAVVCGPLWVSPAEMCVVRVRGLPIPMSVPRQRLLARLLRAGGRVVSREELYRELQSGPLRAGSRAVDVHIARIRRALGPLGRYIVTVPLRGYRIDSAGLSR